jgi:hypothetical protein
MAQRRASCCLGRSFLKFPTGADFSHSEATMVVKFPTIAEFRT